MSLKYLEYREPVDYFPHVLAPVYKENNYMTFLIEAGCYSGKLKQVSLMVLCMEGEVGCFAQTGAYKHYLSLVSTLWALDWGPVSLSIFTTNSSFDLSQAGHTFKTSNHFCWSTLEGPSSFPALFISA